MCDKSPQGGKAVFDDVEGGGGVLVAAQVRNGPDNFSEEGVLWGGINTTIIDHDFNSSE